MITEKENAYRVLTRNDPQWIPCLSDAFDVLFDVSASNDKPEGGEGYDWFGVHWTEGTPAPDERIMNDISEWRDVLKFPDLESIDWEACAQKDLANVDRENKLLMVMHPSGLFERIHAFLGFEETLMSEYTDPDELLALCSAITDYKIEVLQHIIRYYKPDLIDFQDDYGAQKSLFFSPETFRRYYKDNLKRIVDAVHAEGCLFALHCCGKIDEIVGDLVEIGIDVWESVQYCNDLVSIYAKYGDKIAFMPTMDLVVLDHCTPEVAREQVRFTVETLGKYKNVVPKDNSSVLNEESKVAIRDEIRKHGIELYKSQNA